MRFGQGDEGTKETEPGAWQTMSLTDIIHPNIKLRERNVIKCLTVTGQGSGLRAGMQNLCRVDTTRPMFVMEFLNKKFHNYEMQIIHTSAKLDICSFFGTPTE